MCAAHNSYSIFTSDIITDSLIKDKENWICPITSNIIDKDNKASYIFIPIGSRPITPSEKERLISEGYDDDGRIWKIKFHKAYSLEGAYEWFIIRGKLTDPITRVSISGKTIRKIQIKYDHKDVICSLSDEELYSSFVSKSNISILELYLSPEHFTEYYKPEFTRQNAIDYLKDSDKKIVIRHSSVKQDSFYMIDDKICPSCQWWVFSIMKDSNIYHLLLKHQYGIGWQLYSGNPSSGLDVGIFYCSFYEFISSIMINCKVFR